jgi:hypothetical protein
MQAQPRKKVAGVIVTGVVVATLAGAAFLMWQGTQINTRRSAEAPVQVVDAKAVRWWNASDEVFVDGYDVRYRFEAQGKTYQAISEQNTWYRPEMPVKVCYNPADAQDHALAPADQKCGTRIRRV